MPFTMEMHVWKISFSELQSCNFCKMAADHLNTIDVHNVTKIRDSLDSIKLAVSVILLLAFILNIGLKWNMKWNEKIMYRKSTEVEIVFHDISSYRFLFKQQDMFVGIDVDCLLVEFQLCSETY